MLNYLKGGGGGNMKYNFTDLNIVAICDVTKKAAVLLSEEIFIRCNKKPEITDVSTAPCICFKLDKGNLVPNKDSYSITLDSSCLTIFAKGIRGLIYGYSYFLRKTEFKNSRITLIKDISGKYVPDKKIRGHQLGYRTTPNTYDAWSYDDYYRYYRDIMFFGCNICEHIPYEENKSKRNSLMKYDEQEFLVEATRLADALDLDVSLWYPNSEDTTEEALINKKAVFENTPRIDAVFPPGGDPGALDADDFVERVSAISKLLKTIHPNAQMWPSAQRPKHILNWGENFIDEMEKLPKDIDGVITGPNRAYPLHDLRKLLPIKYPIRFYPDITHNVRCEYPVHFNLDDWHYSLSTALSREGINPRPVEYRTIHRLTRRYVVGSVSYSEGVSDDINKMVWSDMDFFPDVPLRDTLGDYARLFFPQVSSEQVIDGILGLEQNWYGDPAENAHIENTLKIWQNMLVEFPDLIENWRFTQHLFRAECDAIVRRRRLFELNLIEEAIYEVNKSGIKASLNILKAELPDDYKALRSHIDFLAEKLFKLIGLQLDVENYGANSWERGATLETVDLPVTDKYWLINRFEYALTLEPEQQLPFIIKVLNRNKVRSDEFYYSLAEHGFDVLGLPQEGEFYINYQGDRPTVNNGSIPMSMLKIYDNITLKCKLGGFLPDTDYKLRITFKSEKYPIFIHHHIIANGVTVYDGPQFGGEKDEIFDSELLAPNFETATYYLPASLFKNGCLELEIGEPVMGVMLSEFWIIRA